MSESIGVGKSSNTGGNNDDNEEDDNEYSSPLIGRILAIVGSDGSTTGDFG